MTTPRLVPAEALARLSQLNLVARWVVEGLVGGLHRSPFHGSSVEFAEYRMYVPGDDLRHFDWKVFGKSDKSYIKKFQTETNLRAHFLVDCSASMGFASAHASKLRYAACTAAALAHLMIRQQDAVGLVLFAERVLRYVAPRSSARHLGDLTAVLEGATAAGTTRIQGALHQMAESIKRRGLVLLLTDLYDDPDAVLKGLKHFRHRKHDVILFQLVDPAERDLSYPGLVEFRNLETGEKVQVRPAAARDGYAREFAAFCERYRRECADASIDYEIVDTSVPFDLFLSRFLNRRLGLNR